MDPQFREDLRSGVSSLSSTAGSINEIIGSGETDLKTTISDINRFTAMLAANTDKMSNTFTSLEAVTDTLAAADIYSSVMN
jgi:ABC-type transporter Mla subunit MlaD